METRILSGYLQFRNVNESNYSRPVNGSPLILVLYFGVFMEQMATWETILLGVMALLLIFWFRPGIKAAIERSQQAEKDWPSALIPIGIVVLFVIFLIAIT